MASKRTFPLIRWAEVRQTLQRQFTGLDPNDPSRWPTLPRMLLLGAVTVLILVLLWFVWLSERLDALDAAQRRERELRTEFTDKLGQAVALDTLKAQLEQVRHFVAQLEKQLPSRAEMDALLSDINQAGIGRGLQFELFRPGQEAVRDYYAELSVTLRVSGSYHDIGMFVADVAHLPRIVILSNLMISPTTSRSDLLTMEATARTFRYLDPDEENAQKAAAKRARGGAK